MITRFQIADRISAGRQVGAMTFAQSVLAAAAIMTTGMTTQTGGSG